MGSTARARLSRRARARLAAEGGFTLPELLVTMAILLIVVASLASVLVSATRSQVDASARFQAQGQARAGLNQLRRELHCASAVTQTSGTALTAGTAYNAISLTLSSVCPTTGGTSLFATWCTSASTLTTGDFALYRVTSTSTPPTCATSGKVKWADYLQPTTLGPPPASTPFCLPSTSAACGGVLKPTTSLPMLHVVLPVNLNGPTSTKDGYNLVDDIALRNGTRS
ncbi:MAG TPA: prepilin-type N-terminal cleavage/methylation domain-containing protein [Gaiellaceae bacterium]|jgi:prepilin-type N-terminal cleavage/methylation domain-containing protein|nr:prepilin-type N-terminal cleavage/methylation domain-containing protein [Gaiellaceae bacterium]